MTAPSHTARRGRSSALRSVGRCLLILCVWQGPVPSWHCHDGVAAADAPSEWLIRHLQWFHPSIRDCATCALGWHLHFGYPQPGNDSEEPSPDSAPGFLPASLEVADSSLAPQRNVPAHLGALLHDLHGASALIGRHPGGTQNTATHFFDHFASTLSLPLRFGVARC